MSTFRADLDMLREATCSSRDDPLLDVLERPQRHAIVEESLGSMIDDAVATLLEMIVLSGSLEDHAERLRELLPPEALRP
jgi:hypothetical protein